MSAMSDVYTIMEELRDLDLSREELVTRIVLCDEVRVRYALTMLLCESYDGRRVDE